MQNGEIYPTKHNGELEIINYISHREVYVRFVSTGFELRTEKRHIISGHVRDKLYPRRFGVGYEGVGTFKLSKNGKMTPAARHWKSMLERCYCPKYKERFGTYGGCSVSEDWHNFQNFAEWFYDNMPEDYYEFRYQIDKDMKLKGNKLYCDKYCSIVKHDVNIAFSKQKSYRFLNPDGVLFEFENLSKFCRENDLTRENMGKVHREERPTHKGWTKA